MLLLSIIVYSRGPFAFRKNLITRSWVSEYSGVKKVEIQHMNSFVFSTGKFKFRLLQPFVVLCVFEYFNFLSVLRGNTIINNHQLSRPCDLKKLNIFYMNL